MTIGYFTDGSINFVGAVFAEKIFNLSLAASLTGKTPIRDLTSLFGEERFKGNLFEDLYERSEGRQECWHGIETLTFLPFFRPGK